MRLNFRLHWFLIHLLFSLLVALVVGYLIYGVWYPRPLDSAMGISKIVAIMAFIQLIVSPLLVLLLAKAGKKGVMSDIIIITLLQLAALSYGIYQLAQARPAWLVFYVDDFEMVQANSVDKSIATPTYQSAPWTGYQPVFVPAPKDSDEQFKRLTYNLQTNLGPTMRPIFYQPFEQAWHTIEQKQHPFSELAILYPTLDKQYSPYNQATGWLPMHAIKQAKIVLVNTDTHQIVAIVDLDPWRKVVK